MSRVRIIGGGAKGTLWRQIVADVLGLTLEKAKVDDSSFGSAMVAAVGVGWYDTFTQAAEANSYSAMTELHGTIWKNT